MSGLKKIELKYLDEEGTLVSDSFQSEEDEHNSSKSHSLSQIQVDKLNQVLIDEYVQLEPLIRLEDILKQKV